MNRIMCAIAVSTLAAAANANAALTTAQSGLLAFDDLDVSLRTQTLDMGDFDVTVTSKHRDLKVKGRQGIFGVGVAGGSVDGEIDGTESIEIAFSEPVFVTSLDLGLLFSNGFRGDFPNEKAKVWSDAGDESLEAYTPTEGRWTGPGSVLNLSPGNNDGVGAWSVIAGPEDGSIFDGPVTKIKLKSGNRGPRANFGDFTFIELEAGLNPIPTPGAAGLLAAGGLLLGSRRRRTA